MIRENFSKHGSEIGFPIKISSVFCAEHVSVFPVGAVAIVNAPLAGSLKYLHSCFQIVAIMRLVMRLVLELYLQRSGRLPEKTR